MNVADVERRVAEIADCAGDDEVAHVEQDRLWLDVLGAIADGAEDAPGLARAALAVYEIEFSRWYA